MKGAVIILSLATKLLFKLSFVNLANLLSGHCHILIIMLWSQTIHRDDAVLVPEQALSMGVCRGHSTQVDWESHWFLPSYSDLNQLLKKRSPVMATIKTSQPTQTLTREWSMPFFIVISFWFWFSFKFKFESFFYFDIPTTCCVCHPPQAPCLIMTSRETFDKSFHFP